MLILTSTQKLIRLAEDPPTDEVIVYQGKNQFFQIYILILEGKSSSIFTSLSSVAQKSSRKWFQKFTDAGEFQQFEAPIQLPQYLTDKSAMVEEYR